MSNGEPQEPVGGQSPQPDPVKPFTGAADNPAQDAKDNQAAKDNWSQRISQAIANLADVTVATVLSNVTVEVDGRGRLSSVTSPITPVPAIITNVNLVDGNVTNVIGPDLKDDTSLTSFHEGLVDKAVKVLPDNLRALANLVESFFK